MFSNFAKNTLSPELSINSIPCNVDLPDLNRQLTNYFLKTYDLYEQLFTLIKSEHSFYTRPEPLRHPLIFYYGHTASFFVNKLIDKGLLKEHVNQKFQRIFAVGVDQNDWDDLDETHYSWPTVSEVKKFRDQVKTAVLYVINKNQQTSINNKSNMWAVLMAIDHERLHIETSAVIIRRLPVNGVVKQPWAKQCLFKRDHPSKVPLNKMKAVPATDFLYDKPIEKADYYGWDSEFGTKRIKTKQFMCSKMLVSNAEFYQFYLDQGYRNMSFWTEEGKAWISKTKTKKPVFWIIKDSNKQEIKNYFLKTLTGEMPMPWDWPAQVNNLEARAFCKWKSEKTGKNIRLPTEDEYFALRNLLQSDYQDWQYQSVGNINLEYWCSPCPVDLFEIEGFCDIVGNVLQHTITPLYPFENFKIDPLYEDFTTPVFDGRHDIIKGGCFMNTGNSATMYYRTGFRRHFYLFTGFRYIESDNECQFPQQHLNQSDQSLKEALKLHYLKPDSYIATISHFVSTCKNQLGNQSLVVGCSVGRLPIELTKYFDTSYGIDYTARYFQMASRLSEKCQLSYQGINIKLKDLKLTQDLLKKVRLHQMNPLNTDKNKINGISFMVVDGFNLKQGTLRDVIMNCFTLFQEDLKCHALIIWPHSINQSPKKQSQMKGYFSQKHNFMVLDSFELQTFRNGLKQKASCYFIEIDTHTESH